MATMNGKTVEEWRPVRGYEGAYEVSDMGRVRSVDRIDCANRNLRGHVLSQKKHSGGYLVVNLWKGGKGRMHLVHSLVLEAFVGPRPEGMEVCHGPGGPRDNRVANIRWGTRSENMRDQVKAGTHKNTRKTHCPRGHVLREPNLSLSFWRRGVRVCRTCTYARTADGYSQERAARKYAELIGEAA